MTRHPAGGDRRMLAVAPFLFVVIWSSGFIVARATVPHAAAELILAVRMLLSAALLGGLAAAACERLPARRQFALHFLAGTLLNGVYLCTSWWAIQRGMPAGVMALLGALQPLVVAVASFGLFGERLGARAWAGLAIGLAGVGLVLAPILVRGGHATAPVYVVAAGLGRAGEYRRIDGCLWCPRSSVIIPRRPRLALPHPLRLRHSHISNRECDGLVVGFAALRVEASLRYAPQDEAEF